MERGRGGKGKGGETTCLIPPIGFCLKYHPVDGATLFSKLDSNKLRFIAKNEMTLICAKFDADLINISKVTSRKTKWPRFLAYPVGTYK